MEDLASLATRRPRTRRGQPQPQQEEGRGGPVRGRRSRLQHSSTPHHHEEASCSSVPASPPSSHHVPFHHRQLGDWARAKRLEEILAVFPPDLSLAEFSHLAPAPQLLTAPARGDSAPPPLVIAGGGAVVAVVTPPRLQEKVMVALTAARAARVQALEVCGTPGTSPLTLSPVSRRSLDTPDPSSRCASSSVPGVVTWHVSRLRLSTRSLNTLQSLGSCRLGTSSAMSGSASS